MNDKPRAEKLPSALERLELVLLGIARAEPATRLCLEAGVSRELFYRWMRAARAGALQALEAKAPGPKRVRAEKAPQEPTRPFSPGAGGSAEAPTGAGLEGNAAGSGEGS